MTHNISVKAEFISNDVVIEETVTLKYVLADYPAGTQYATETHKLDENTSISTEKLTLLLSFVFITAQQ